MRVLIRRLWRLLQRSRIEADLAEEMDFHREMKERELARLGTSPAETASAARRALGSVALAQDRSLDVWLSPWLDGFLHDLRFALRGLRRDRAFTFAAIAILALAIGLNVTVGRYARCSARGCVVSNAPSSASRSLCTSPSRCFGSF